MAAINKKILSHLLKITIVSLAFWFIIRKLVSNDNLLNFIDLLKQADTLQIILVLGVVILLMLMNWGLEVWKWKRLVRNIEKISVQKAIQSVFCGLTLAVFTPSRIGEYGGRVFFLSPKRRIVGIVAMAVGNIGQMVLTNIFGAIASCFFIYRFVPVDTWLFYVILVAAAGFCLFMAMFYFNIGWIRGILLSFKLTRKYHKFYDVLSRYPSQELLRILMFCLGRYIVFSTQYFILLQWLIPGLNYAEVLMMLCILFFIQSSLPSLDLFDIGVRSLTATYFFSFITTNEDNVAVIATTACIWLINIIIPAILGTYFVFKLNFFGSNRRN
ncbi:MAG: hypothetical protein EOO89_10320 [Pedobacter sp.]|nr:MAG: hypothetical protein EOO89_10320 [Pedobacter sp.]